MNPDDCKTGHAEAKSSALAFKLRTRPIAPHPDPDFGPLPQGNCIVCQSTIVLPPEVNSGD